MLRNNDFGMGTLTGYAAFPYRTHTTTSVPWWVVALHPGVLQFADKRVEGNKGREHAHAACPLLPKRAEWILRASCTSPLLIVA